MKKEFTLAAKPESWEPVRSFLYSLPQVSEADRLSLCLIAEEIMSNIIFYAYPSSEAEGQIGVAVDCSEGCCRVTFTDSGIPFNQQPDAETAAYDCLARVGGAGRLLAASMADGTHYDYRDGKNIFSFEKILTQTGKEEQ